MNTMKDIQGSLLLLTLTLSYSADNEQFRTEIYVDDKAGSSTSREFWTGHF